MVEWSDVVSRTLCKIDSNNMLQTCLLNKNKITDYWNSNMFLEVTASSRSYV